MKIKVEKMNCPNCNSTTMEIDYDNYLAHCPNCDANYPIQIEDGKAIFLAREQRQTMKAEYEEQRKSAAAEYEEQRKTVEFLHEEERKTDEFNRTKGFRNASDKLKWAKRGIVFGLIIGIILFLLSKNIIVSILSLAATIVLFIPRIFDDKKNLNVWTKVLCGVALIALGAYSGYANNARKAAAIQEQHIAADEAAAQKIPLGVSSQEVNGIDYNEAVRRFKDNGFTNIETKAVEDLDISNYEEGKNTVCSVTIKGNTTFLATDVYPENVKITVNFHHISDKKAKIQVGTASEKMLGQHYTSIQANLTGAGFTNIELKPIYDLNIGLLTKEGSVESVSIAGQTKFYDYEEFRFYDPVVISYHAKKSEEKNNHDGELQIPLSSKKYIGRNYEDVEKELRNAGFENIEIVRKTAQSKKEKDGEIVLISVNGRTDFDKNEWFVKESNIVITYYGPKTQEELQEEHPDQINVPDSAKELKKNNYEEAVDLLTSAGFTNITAEPIYDLKTGIVNKDGSIESISIDGKSDFNADDWFDPDVEIKITYHTFEETEESTTTEK